MRYAAVFCGLGVILARSASQWASAEFTVIAWSLALAEAYLAVCLFTLSAAYALNHWSVPVDLVFHRPVWRQAVDMLLLPYRLIARGVCVVLRRFDSMAMMDAVAPRLYVGRIPLRHERSSLLAAGVNSVLNLCVEFPHRSRLRNNSGLETVYVPMLDGAAPSVKQFERAIEFIARRHAEGHTVLIHCAQGRGRSVTVAAAALCRLGIASDPEDALARITAARPKASPSLTQRAALRRFVAAA